MQKVLYGTKIGEPDYKEQIITENAAMIDKAKAWAIANGFDRLRVAVIDIFIKPDFIGTINTNKKPKL